MSSLANEGEAESVAEDPWLTDPSNYYEKRRISRAHRHRHGEATDSRITIEDYAMAGPHDASKQLELQRTIDPNWVITRFEYLDESLSNLPKEVPRPAEYGFHPGIHETYASSMTKQVCTAKGLLADPPLTALNRGKGENVKEDEDDGYYQGVLNAYCDQCARI